jgi:glycosyltransferase involved in cell wall biosynthesis
MQHKYNIIQTDEYHYGTYKLEMAYSDFRDTNNEAAYAIINIIKNYDNILLKKILASQKKYVTEKYTWENIVNDWIKMFKLNA